MIFEKMSKEVHSIMTKIIDHPFNQELAKGILSKEKFIHYLQQDALYLADFSRALALTAARLSCNEQAHQFMQFAIGAIKAEQELHLDYLKQHSSHSAVKQSPACFMYTNYLLRMATMASVEEAVASLLPCFWVYREVGSTIFKTQGENNPYKSWIQLYSGEQFAASVNLAINVTNKLSDFASEEIKVKMISAFVRSTQLEWYFWESAYNQEDWLY